ncbi:hypothetical protein GCM10010345_91760 [Streptomyces canarius]|uniref:Uncharacterized protein n=1 Tax=Streptomyces canarius TaxID=285453 RepID=A0ABQ3DCM6_9ACTN|nr:hypothetical protein GCM10010345_91760 [Streptomyces canarius]
MTGLGDVRTVSDQRDAGLYDRPVRRSPSAGAESGSITTAIRSPFTTEPLRNRWRLYALTPAAGWGWS